MLEAYKTISTILGYILMVIAPIMAFIALFNPSSRVGFLSFIISVILQPGLIALSGLGAIAFAELIELVQTVREEVRDVKNFIDEARQKRQK